MSGMSYILSIIGCVCRWMCVTKLMRFLSVCLRRSRAHDWDVFGHAKKRKWCFSQNIVHCLNTVRPIFFWKLFNVCCSIPAVHEMTKFACKFQDQKTPSLRVPQTKFEHFVFKADFVFHHLREKHASILLVTLTSTQLQQCEHPNEPNTKSECIWKPITTVYQSEFFNVNIFHCFPTLKYHIQKKPIVFFWWWISIWKLKKIQMTKNNLVEYISMFYEVNNFHWLCKSNFRNTNFE